MSAGNGHPAMAADRAGQDYWEGVWQETALPIPIETARPGVRHHARRRLQEWFARHIPRGLPATNGSMRPARLIEVGCARSVWLPWFAREFGCEVTGLDYSPTGCEQAEAVLNAAGVSGTIACADLFNPPEALRGAFDVVVTFGVVEHFEDTAGTVAALAELATPGGVVLTIIPNMVGAVGWAQKTLNRPVYDIHVPLDSDGLAAGHTNGGLDVEACEYLVCSHFAVANLNGVPLRTPSGVARRLLHGALAASSVALWVWDERVRTIPTGRWLSPYIACAARRVKGAEAP
jgi:SAM-dependent methyltransferase